MTGTSRLANIDDAVADIPTGASVFLGGAVLDRKPMALVRALAEAGPSDLDVYTFAGSLAIDVLIAAGIVNSATTAYVGLGPEGRAPAFTRAVLNGTIDDLETSEWLLLGRLRAASMGVPFLPTRAATGTELLAHADTKIVEDPYTGVEYLALAPLHPDVTLLHAWRATADGHVQFAWPPDHLWDVDVIAARAARLTVVTVEEIVTADAAAAHAEWTRLLPVDVDAVVVAPGGAWPTATRPCYEADHGAVRAYAASGDLGDLIPEAVA
jgi:glutaconate CoA-transferase subunit A